MNSMAEKVEWWKLFTGLSTPFHQERNALEATNHQNKLLSKSIGIYKFQLGPRSIFCCSLHSGIGWYLEKEDYICIYVLTAAQAHIPFTRLRVWQCSGRIKSHAHIQFTRQNSLTRDTATPNVTSNFTAAKRSVGRLKVWAMEQLNHLHYSTIKKAQNSVKFCISHQKRRSDKMQNI